MRRLALLTLLSEAKYTLQSNHDIDAVGKPNKFPLDTLCRSFSNLGVKVLMMDLVLEAGVIQLSGKKDTLQFNTIKLVVVAVVTDKERPHNIFLMAPIGEEDVATLVVFMLMRDNVLYFVSLSTFQTLCCFNSPLPFSLSPFLPFSLSPFLPFSLPLPLPLLLFILLIFYLVDLSPTVHLV